MNTKQTEQETVSNPDVVAEQPLEKEDLEHLVQFFALLIKVDQRVNGNKYRDACKETTFDN